MRTEYFHMSKDEYERSIANKHADSMTTKAFGRIINHCYNINGKKKNPKSMEDSYKFVPASTQRIVTTLTLAYKYLRKKTYDRYEAIKFLDAGCGVGNTMLLAQIIGFRSYGLELNPTLIKQAKQFNPVAKNILYRNIITYKDYGKYDVIYYYVPIMSYPKERKFEEHVEDTMKVGAVIVPFGKVSNKIMDDHRFRRVRPLPRKEYDGVTDNFYVKIRD